MKHLSKYILGACLMSMSLTQTSCIEEVFPTDGMTEEQLESSPKAVEAMLWGIPGFVNNFGIFGTGDPYHFDFGYGAMIHIRDLMTEDMAIASSYSSWWQPWHINLALGESYLYPQFIWNYYYKFIQTSNMVIKNIDPETAIDPVKGYLGAAYAFRAMQYLDMAQMFEFLPNDVTSNVNAAGNDVSGLTVPIVTEKTTPEEAANNPRATREKMAEFILSDLQNAEQYIPYLEITAKSMPHLDAVYGLMARYYLWLGDYGNAKTYARKAIDESGHTPLTKEEWLSTTSGFNDASYFMWASETVKESDVVSTGIINFTSWLSNETTYGYCGAGAYVMMGKSVYDRMSNTDFRKLAFKSPEGGMLEGQEPCIDAEHFKNLPAYASLKFRPGQGNMNEYQIGSATSFPMMRVEEMHFIEMEATAHLDEAAGRKMLYDFMRNYRDHKYVLLDTDETIDEIIFQKRIELWGEGLSYYDVKRLDMSVTRGYTGTNFFNQARLNTEGRPAWMNMCIVQTEKNNNEALVGYENPDSSGMYTAWTPQ